MPEPFIAHVELPREVRRSLHRAQIYLSIAPANPFILRVAIVPAEERCLEIPTGQVEGAPKVTWIPTPCEEAPG